MDAQPHLVGSYEVGSRIGDGGMGSVYRAVHILRRTPVALKVLMPHLARDERVRTRFQQEAWVQHQLQHPSVVAVHDLIVAGEVLAIAMDLVEGPSLGQVLAHERPGPWPVADVLRVFVPVVEAVALAHSRGVVHRDLKPENVLLDRSGDAAWPGLPKVADFGIAKVVGSSAGVTRTGAMMGTLAYMAPEQFEGGKDVDARADVFALGMMCWRLVTGRLPVDPERTMDVARMYMGAIPIPALSDVAEGVPPSLSVLVARCLSVDPAARPGDAGAVRAGLEDLVQELQASGRDSAWAPTPPTPGPEAQGPPAGDGEAEADGVVAEDAEEVTGPGEPEQDRAMAPVAVVPEAPVPEVRPSQSWRSVGILAAAGGGLVVLVLTLVLAGHDGGSSQAGHRGSSPREESVGAALATGAAPGSAADALDWVRAPEGSFRMGSTNGKSDETPVHLVRVGAFRMTRSEVTVAQYRACVEQGPCTRPDTGVTCNWGVQGRDGHPVNCVDWEQARTFARWVGGRLPTEAEWEWAARGGQSYPYAGSASAWDVAWYDDNSGGTTHGTCLKAKNGFGLCDMSGNVREWVEDRYHGGYAGAPEDGSAWITGGSEERVVRGGSWRYGANAVRVTSRDHSAASYRSGRLGFRVVK